MNETIIPFMSGFGFSPITRQPNLDGMGAAAPIRASTRKHGVADEYIRDALRNWIRVADEDSVRIVHAIRLARDHRFESGR